MTLINRRKFPRDHCTGSTLPKLSCLKPVNQSVVDSWTKCLPVTGILRFCFLKSKFYFSLSLENTFSFPGIWVSRIIISKTLNKAISHFTFSVLNIGNWLIEGQIKIEQICFLLRYKYHMTSLYSWLFLYRQIGSLWGPFGCNNLCFPWYLIVLFFYLCVSVLLGHVSIYHISTWWSWRIS